MQPGRRIGRPLSRGEIGMRMVAASPDWYAANMDVGSAARLRGGNESSGDGTVPMQ